jgi:hypothetical protein
MRRTYWLIMALALSCSDSAVFAQTRVNPPLCKKADASFRSFLSRFTDDLEFQRGRLVTPLVARAGDNVTTEMTIELWTLDHIKSLKYPLIYSSRERKKQDLDQSILLQTKRYAEVFQQQREADAIRMQYRFQYYTGCWFLIEVEDLGE